jgi:hypothetical protein
MEPIPLQALLNVFRVKKTVAGRYKGGFSTPRRLSRLQ